MGRIFRPSYHGPTTGDAAPLEHDFKFVCPSCGGTEFEYLFDPAHGKLMGFKCGCGWRGSCRKILCDGKEFKGWDNAVFNPRLVAAGIKQPPAPLPEFIPDCPECGEPVKSLHVSAPGMVYAEFSVEGGYVPTTYAASIAEGEFSCPSCGTVLFNDERSAVRFFEEEGTIEDVDHV